MQIRKTIFFWLSVKIGFAALVTSGGRRNAPKRIDNLSKSTEKANLRQSCALSFYMDFWNIRRQKENKRK